MAVESTYTAAAPAAATSTEEDPMTETQEGRQGAVVERSLAFAVRGETATIKQSGVGVVATTGATDVRQSMAASVLSGGGVSLSQGAATAVVAAGDVEMRQGGAQWVFSAGDVSVEWGGAAVMAAPTVKVERGMVGLVLARHAELGDGVRVILQPRGAAALGAGVGLAVATVMAVAGAGALRRLVTRRRD
jgi:hypothetical protein